MAISTHSRFTAPIVTAITERAAHPGAHLGATAARWTARGLSTAPADRTAAEDATRTAYRLAGLAPPARIVWFGSPAAGARAAALLTGRRPLPGGPDAPHADREATEIDAEVAEALREQGCPPTPGSAGVAVRSEVRTQPWAAARQEAHTALGPDGWAQLWTGCAADVWRTVVDRVATPLRSALRAQLPEWVGDVLLDSVGGQHDAGWLAAFDAAEPSTFEAARRLAGLAGVARTAGWWWPYANVAILTERPAQLHRDNIGRLHAADAPAVRYPDGFALHAWRGMPIPPELVARLSGLTHREIAEEPNAELRRVMLEHYGYARYLRKSGGRKLATDEFGSLWTLGFDDDEPLVMVEVLNSTPEPDGTSRVYWLRVPPTVRTPREGVAWTFGLTEQEYRPLVQT